MKDTRIAWPLFVCLVLFLVSRVSAAPFTIDPPGSTNLLGDTIRLLTLDNGVPADPALTFQWSFKNVTLTNDGRITGSRSRELIIANAAFTDSGVYAVTISTGGVAVATVSANVAIVDEPEILAVTSETVGVDVTFRANATGGLLAYQWLWQGREIAGATNSFLRYTNAYTIANAGFYSVRVTNLLGSVTSSPNTLLFTKPAPTGTYQGIYLINGAPTPEEAGFFQFTISGSARTFSGKIMSGTNVVRASGAFSQAHTAEALLPGANGELVPVQLQLLTTNDNAQILGLSTNLETQIFMLGNRLYYSSKVTNALAGKYTLALQNTNTSPLVPNGDGWARLKITSAGKVTLSGVAADGSAFSQSTGLSRLGDWPLYASLNNHRGRLLGILRVNKQTTSSIRGTNIVWIKSAGPDRLYPDGFDITLEGNGSTFVPPVAKQPVIAWTNGVVSLGHFFSDGSILWEFVQVTLRPPSTFKAEQGTQNLQLSASKGSGVVSGRFTDPVTALRDPISGVILQQQRVARGFFLSTNYSGQFIMERR